MDNVTKETGGCGKTKTGDGFSFIKIGHVGDENGDKWDEKGHDNIVQILISHDEEINSIQFQYVKNGNLMLSDMHGANVGRKFDVVKLNYPSEFITWVIGHKNYGNNICSITFGTNRGKYGPFGKFTSHDEEFCFRLGDDRQFGGFYGTADGKHVKSLGVYFTPISTLDCLVKKNIVRSTKESERWEVLH